MIPANAPAQRPQPMVIRAGTMLDGRGGVRHSVDIYLSRGRIDSIRPARVGVTATHNFTNGTVMPGLIDTHVHINWHFDPDGKTHHLPAGEETREEQYRYASQNARATVLSGITTVQSLGASIDKDLRDSINAGIIPGPRVITSLGSVSGGSPEQIRQSVRRFVENGADVIKVFASASIRDGGAATMTIEQLTAACGEALLQGKRSVVHAHGSDAAILASRAGCTTIEHGSLLDRAALDTLVARGTFYDPNIGLVLQNYLENRSKYLGIGNYTEEGFRQMEAAIPKALATFRTALDREGLRIVFGTDAVAGAHGRNVEELIYRVRQGTQDELSAITSATATAATSLGLQHTIGTIEPGMAADLIGVRGDVLSRIESLRNVTLVIRNGIVLKATR